MNIWIDQLPNGRKTEFSAGSYLAQPNQSSNSIFAIEKGRARILLMGSVREQTLGYLEVGSIFVTHTPTWIEATEPVTIVSWPIMQLRGLIIDQPDIAMIALREIGKLMHNSLMLIEDLAFRSVEERLARYLLSQMDTDDQTVTLRDTTETLATLLGTSRQTLSSMLTRLQKNGAISKRNRQVFQIVDVDYLGKLANALSDS